MAKNIVYSKILEDEASFQLVRTNPKLTGNVKFTVDLNGNMWLNSIDANEELAKDQYKRVAIDSNISLPGNLFKFFNGGSTPSEIVFGLTENFDPTKTSKDFKDQFDFSHYFSGARYLISKKYEERLSYFAPLYLKKDIPEFFIIFKIENPLNKPINEITENYINDREQYLKDLFKTSSIIKTFDLRETSKVGKYLRNIINDPKFPINPLTVNYQENRYTEWNGILFDSGVFGSRGEQLYSFYQQSNPLKYFEEFITLGFQRNGVIFPNILNMEFIFDDETSELYDFNRYFGVYVNAIELSKLEIDLDRAYLERGIWENDARLKRKYYHYEETTLTQKNENGVIIPVNKLEVFLSDFENIFSDKDNFYFNFIADKNDNLYLPKLDSPYSIDYDESSNELLSAKIRLSNKEIDLADFFGPASTFLQDVGTASKLRGFSTGYLKVNSTLKHLDEIRFYHPNGTRVDVNGKYDLLVATENYSVIPNPGDFYFYNDIDNVTGYDIFYFNCTGSALDIANAIHGCISNIRNRSFKSYVYQDYVFIKASSAGDYDNLFKLQFTSPVSEYSSVTINDVTGVSLIGLISQFEGGSKSDKNRLVIDAGHYSKISNDISNLLVNTKNGWSPIKKLSKYSDVITEENSKGKDIQLSAINEFFNKIVVTLELEEEPNLTYGQFLIRRKARPIFGLLSLFPIKDFSFDFYSSEYLNFPIIDLYKYYFIPSGVNLLVPGVEYEVRGTGSILFEGTEYSVGSTFIPSASPNNYSYSISSGDPFVTYSISDASLVTPINDENKELQGFPGFFVLKDPDRVVPETEDRDFQLRLKYLNGITQTEYDFYKENYSKDFATKSKMIPYITKWVISDGLDARNNPYRLNTELIFGFNNFSPDHEDRTQNPSNFTHEWFYLESKFDFVNDETTIKLNDSYFETPLDINKLLTDDGYFIDYFTYTPTFNGKEIGKTQSRYVPIKKNVRGEYEAFFKGFRIQFRDFIDPNNLLENGKPAFNTNSSRFDDYKFTCLLKTVKEDINNDTQPPIRYRFIEHKTFKFIILVIELTIGAIQSIDDYWKIEDIGSPSPILGVDNSNFLDGDSRLSSMEYNSINGEYRISFETVDGIEISDITQVLLYSLDHKKFNNTLNNFSNIKLSSKLNLNASGAFNSGNNIEKLNNLNIPKYPSILKDEIINTNDSTFVIGRNNLLGQDFFIDYAPLLIPQNLSKLTGASETSVSFSTAIDISLINEASAVTSLIPTALPATFYQNNFTFKIMGGGENYYTALFSKLAFGSFKQYVNSGSSFIEYESYSILDNVLTQEPSVTYYTEIPDRQNIIKDSAIIAQVDDNKPSNFSFNSLIGFKYERAALDKTYEINRYDGGFSPLFNDILPFNSKFKFTKNDIETLDLSNTLLNLNIDNFFTLVNFSHIKVADLKILDLEADNIFEPRYELINEISINRENYFLPLSNWDLGFHFKYSNKTQYSPVPGTLRVEEDDSFISKLLSLRKEIELETFDTLILGATDKIENVNLNDIELVYKENQNTIEGYFNLNNALTSFLLSDGISEKFEEFLSESTQYLGNFETIEDYVIEYIRLNILKLYDLLEIQFYTKIDTTLVSTLNTVNVNTVAFEFLDDKGRNDKGFKLSKNLRINKFDRLILKFTFNKELNGGLVISPKIKIKFI